MKAARRTRGARFVECGCIAKMNKKLEVEGIGIDWAWLDVHSDNAHMRCAVLTERKKLRSRKRMTRVLATYCPFCGVKYPEAS